MVKAESVTDNYTGRNIWFGVRGVCYAAAMNGNMVVLCLWWHLLLVFSNYLLPAVIWQLFKLASNLCYDTRPSSSW